MILVELQNINKFNLQHTLLTGSEPSAIYSASRLFICRLLSFTTSWDQHTIEFVTWTLISFPKTSIRCKLVTWYEDVSRKLILRTPMFIYCQENRLTERSKSCIINDQGLAITQQKVATHEVKNMRKLLDLLHKRKRERRLPERNTFSSSKPR